ncbi:MAG TPA: histidine kinase dimerization/phospho-acceptor domain-containing protein, partial [Streptosporangiaceae bacterium]
NGRWLDVLCTSLADSGELVIDFRDVTAAKELEEAKDLFLATTSHELRTPITVVQGFASTLASRWDQLADTERLAAVRTIAERAGSLSRLVEQLLLGSRAGADQLPVTNGPFDLGAVLHGAAAAFRPLSDKHVVVADIPDGLPAASGDTMATDIIVGQLLENAFKYSPDGGELVVDFRDVTAAKELEEAKDLFLATTSHELRTPITVVQGFASTLATRWDQLADTERRAAVRTIAERAGSLGRLVEQLLLGSRAGADQLPVNNGPFDLDAVLRGAVAAFRPLSDKHVVVAEIPDGLPSASGDTMATDIIVGQLLENAFKYSPDGGTVSVRARVKGEGEVGGGWIEVTVEDEGVGIADGDHERIFDRFFQAETGDRRRFGGVGIGLFIVRRLAEAQHGEVTASTRPSGGTAMCLRLRPAAS